MTKHPSRESSEQPSAQDDLAEIALTDDDILEAMREIPGYLDITTMDFRAVYRLAHRHAIDRLFSGIAAVAWLNQWFFVGTDLTLAIGSLGASAVLVFGAVRSPLAQPRNLIGGHVLSALVGVTCWQWLGDEPWLAQSVAVATAIALMHLTRTLHPPGGATALIAVIGSEQVHAMGYLFVLLPATLGPLVLLIVALLFNNLPAARRYPEFWL